MAFTITRFPLSRFDELLPLMLRCFPEFWEARLARGQRSFPYDLRVFAGRLDGRLIACAGLHPYQILLQGEVLPLYGLCDVAVDPDWRGRGYGRRMQDFAIRTCRKSHLLCPAIPLYTDKPGVYRSAGWHLYTPRRDHELPPGLCPQQNAFSLAEAGIRADFLRPHPQAPHRAEQLVRTIQEIYMAGRVFPGKCLRSGKTWSELFADPAHTWHLDADSYGLFRHGCLIEAYARHPDHPAARFTPKQGGHDDNKIMLNLVHPDAPAAAALAATIASQELIFPLADVF